jgi:uncharacterized protein (TIGR03067 family)
MSYHHAITLVIAVVFAAGNGTQSTAQDDKQVLQGTWHAVSYVENGKRAPFEKLPSRGLSIRGNNWLISGEVSGVFALDPSSDGPKAIDLLLTRGPDQGQRVLGIYDLRYGTFKTCFARPGRKRPAEFKADAGTQHELTFYKRDPS